MKFDVKKYGRIGVLMGGVSSEREISLRSGKAIANALTEEGGDVISLDLMTDNKKDVIKLLKDNSIDIAFIALHGRFGEDGQIQTILDSCDIPYPGSGVEASQRAINKITTQELLKKNKILVPSFVIVTRKNNSALDEVKKMLNSSAVVVKPANEGSSIGVTIVETVDQLSAALELAWKYGGDVLVEQFIKGREMTVGVIDRVALPPIEVCPQAKFFDFNAKYQSPATQYKIPAQIPETQSDELKQLSLKVFDTIGCADFSRIDFICSDNGKNYVLEINTIPGFTATSLLPKAAKLVGMSFNHLCLTLLDLAYAKKKTKHTFSSSR